MSNDSCLNDWFAHKASNEEESIWLVARASGGGGRTQSCGYKQIDMESVFVRIAITILRWINPIIHECHRPDFSLCLPSNCGEEHKDPSDEREGESEREKKLHARAQPTVPPLLSVAYRRVNTRIVAKTVKRKKRAFHVFSGWHGSAGLPRAQIDFRSLPCTFSQRRRGRDYGLGLCNK